ncbi:DUF3549 family protein [Aliagarivorans taiwanensis]|uniref:DUF3549 family protein n=1 Tax=Aliagarivorans taiwanensis TaxID=561966 RepID=UPI00040C9589|nr:DUF3549 family protein [Aliagarivorans taiwanensis]
MPSTEPSTMPKHSLTEILQQSGSEVHIFEMGRLFREIEPEELLQIERAERPYPAPIQQHACFALAFWQRVQSRTPYIWFLRFPVDEQGFLNLGCRDQFIDQLKQAMGQQLERQLTEQEQQQLANTPYIFKPTSEKMALFHASYSRKLDMSASQGFERVQQYVQSGRFEQWQSLPLQGLADFVVRLDSSEIEQSLVDALPHLPEQMFEQLVVLLEHQVIGTALTQALAARLAGETTHSKQVLLLRAMASSSETVVVEQALDQLLSQAGSEELLIAVAGRLWPALQQLARLKRFLELLSEQHNPALFYALFRDLVALPDLRTFVLAVLRDNDISPSLKAAIQQMTQHVQQH